MIENEKRAQYHSRAEFIEKGQMIMNSTELQKINAYWRAANYWQRDSSTCWDNPLLRRPLTRDDVKKKIVGHWGTVPGQNFVYVHLNRIIKKYDQDLILISGPGHGGNFFVATPTWTHLQRGLPQHQP